MHNFTANSKDYASPKLDKETQKLDKQMQTFDQQTQDLTCKNCDSNTQIQYTHSKKKGCKGENRQLTKIESSKGMHAANTRPTANT